ncbi:polysaccharide biosynthesis tyrosine autokinase [Ferrimonas balearica]|uniref:polysaccharide biosynthesis tyrosine autokinase n=1 Tax=Ferrimonas balearica TaxID=44012 RepID=UPI001C98A159|nr:polysaccharide biosynthesis tyrosine autokinase [Ferrimonas balearica]MBY6105292.1 polysaccharide biosynthesis tyrosine autokinase [Ferrimonas balearica]
MSASVSVVANGRTADSDEIDLGKLFGHLLDGWKSIAIITGVCACLGAAYAIMATPQYQADALIQVEPKSSGIPGLSEVSEMFASESEAVTEIELIKSRMVLGQVVDALDMTTVAEPVRLPVFGSFIARLNAGSEPSQWLGYGFGGEQIALAQLDVPAELIDEELFLYAEGEGHYRLTYDEEPLLQGKVGEVSKGQGVTLEVTQLHAAPGTVFRVAKLGRNAVVEAIRKELSVSERGKSSGILALNYSGDNVEEIVAVLNHVADYYLLQNVKRMSAQASNSLEFLDSNMPKVKAELEAAEVAMNQFQSQMRTVDMSLETEAILKQVVEFEKRLNDLNIKETEVQQLYTRSHPVYQALIKQRESLTAQRDELTGQIEGLPEVQQTLLRLRRDVEVAQTIYVELLNRAQELAIVEASTVGTVRIIDHAEVKPEPIAPKKPLIVVLATLLGGMLSVAFVLVRAMINRGVETPDELEGIGLSVYATVPKSDFEAKLEAEQRRLPIEKRLSGGDALLAKANPADLSIEALRSLRTSLHFAMLEASNNILMISGPAPAVGKSFISANLATVMAQAGQKVLLIDGDMRRGYMQRIMGSKWDDGLSDYLAGKASREAAVRKTDIEGLDFIPRGQIPPNPAELLMLPGFKSLMDWASENYDLVIIDTPPILAVTDPAIVGRIAGTSILVVKHQVSPLKEIEYSVQRFATSGIQIKGVILNQQVKSRASAYDYGYYQYEYKSGQ